jgi:hypothetical protein
MPEDASDATEGATRPLIGSSELPAVEVQLEQLAAAALDTTHALPTQFSPIAHAFGHRGRSLWRGIRHATEGPSAAAAHALVRSLFEAWVLLRWLELNPDMHVPLWQADHERHALELLREPEAVIGRRLAAKFRDWAPDGLIARKEESIAKARADGRAAGVKSVSRKPDGRLLPSMPEMIEAISAPAISEGYAVIYPLSSAFIHSSAGAVLGTVAFDEAAKTFDIDDGPLADEVPVRMLAATVFAGLLTDVSLFAELGVEEDSDLIRRALVANIPADYDPSAISAPLDEGNDEDDSLRTESLSVS